MDYLGSLTNSIFSLVFIIFLIGTVGYFIGAISIRGISLGTAGVLLTALLYGIIAHFVPSFSLRAAAFTRSHTKGSSLRAILVSGAASV